MLPIIQWIVAGLAGFVAGMLLLVQPISIYRGMREIASRNEDRHISPVWVVGSVAGVLAVLAAPISSFEQRVRFWWAPFAAEAASVILLSIAFRVTGLAKILRLQQKARRSATAVVR